MLILSRKLGQRIVIGEGIVIEVRYFDRDRVAIGIEAPKDVPIWRAELLGPGEAPCSLASR